MFKGPVGPVAFLAVLALAGLVRSEGGTENFAGTWTLLSYTFDGGHGEVADPPLGGGARGWIMYDPTGRMCVQISAPDRRRFASGDILVGAPEEKRAAYETYIAYCGTYAVHDGFIVHRPDVSLFPNWVGSEQKRFFDLSGDRLTLRSPPFLRGGTQWTARLVWERVH